MFGNCKNEIFDIHIGSFGDFILVQYIIHNIFYDVLGKFDDPVKSQKPLST